MARMRRNLIAMAWAVLPMLIIVIADGRRWS
jgi:hypothetical protein